MLGAELGGVNPSFFCGKSCIKLFIQVIISYIKLGGIMMIEKIKKNIKKNELFKNGDKIIIGVSGGPDSVALLHAMKKIAGEMQLLIIAAHLNHGLREEADDEQEYVRMICNEWKIPFYARKVEIKKLAREEKRSLEDMGRKVRYEYFNDLLIKTGADSVVTAHHQGDVAETVLLHLLRGAGIKGLRGIMPKNNKIIRPLLFVSKKEILSYLEDNKLLYCVDKSNEDFSYLRNSIRYELIPFLQEKYNPRIIESLNQLADIAREENEVLEDITKSLWNEVIISQDKESIIMDTNIVLMYTLAYKRRIVQHALFVLTGETGWNMNDVDRIIELFAKKGSSKILYLKNKLKVNKSYDKIIFTRYLEKTKDFSYELKIPGTVFIQETDENYSFKIMALREYSPDEGDIYLDNEKLEYPLYLRSRRAGDVFQPPGLTGHKKIKDFFIDSKIPYLERNKIALLTSHNNQIYALLGWRIDQKAAVTSDSKDILVIKKIRNV